VTSNSYKNGHGANKISIKTVEAKYKNFLPLSLKAET
jgi:hypothetical protein